jgi:glycosyltransferase involved in cell wall biosynthesis
VKVLLLIDNLGAGGAQTQILNLALYLNVKHNVTLFYYGTDDFNKYKVENTKVNIISFHKKTKIGWEIIWMVSKLIKTHKFDFVISFLDTPNFYSVISKILTFSKSYHIISYRSKTNFKSLNFFRKFLLVLCNFYADRIIFNSNHECLNWISKYPSIKKKSFVVYNSIDPHKFKKCKLDWEYERKNSFIIVGSIVESKNLNLALDALIELVVMRNYNVNITHIGRVISNNVASLKYYRKLVDKISKYNLESHWTWEESSTSIEVFYLNSDALILPSTLEGLPNVVCESLACSKPVIVSNILEHPYLVKDGANGFLFDPYSVDSLVNVLINFMNLTDIEYSTICNRAKVSADKLFNVDNYKDFIINDI